MQQTGLLRLDSASLGDEQKTAACLWMNQGGTVELDLQGSSLDLRQPEFNNFLSLAGVKSGAPRAAERCEAQQDAIRHQWCRERR